MLNWKKNIHQHFANLSCCDKTLKSVLFVTENGELLIFVLIILHEIDTALFVVHLYWCKFPIHAIPYNKDVLRKKICQCSIETLRLLLMTSWSQYLSDIPAPCCKDVPWKSVALQLWLSVNNHKMQVGIWIYVTGTSISLGMKYFRWGNLKFLTM